MNRLIHIFVFFALNIIYGYMYLLEPPHRGGSNLYQQAMFKAKILKLPFISTMNLSNFAAEKIFSCLLFIYLFIYLFMQYLARVMLSVYRMGNFFVILQRRTSNVGILVVEAGF